jgi:hypothetical protein
MGIVEPSTLLTPTILQQVAQRLVSAELVITESCLEAILSTKQHALTLVGALSLHLDKAKFMATTNTYSTDKQNLGVCVIGLGQCSIHIQAIDLEV